MKLKHILCVAVLVIGCSARGRRIDYGGSHPSLAAPQPVATAPIAPAVAVAGRSFSPLLPTKPANPGGAKTDGTNETHHPSGPPTDPVAVIASANAASVQKPDSDSYFNAIQEYVFAPGTLYQLYSSRDRVTTVILQPGEKLVGEPVIGKKVRWAFARGVSETDGVATEHVYLKPIVANADTNIVINTTRRSYFLEVHCLPETYMAAVRWAYPEDELVDAAAVAAAEAAHEQNASPLVSLENVSFDYVLEVVEGDPDWIPTVIFDDGRKTFIRFPAGMRRREVPVLFAVRSGQAQLVNYRPREARVDGILTDLYEVDRLLDVGELRLGQDELEIVRFARGGKGLP